MARPRVADTGVVAHLFVDSDSVFDAELGRPRPIEYALAVASHTRGTAHAVLETEEKTLCGRDFDVELTDYRKPSDLGGEEPNCRVCRKALRRRADRLRGEFRRELPRLGCRHCGSLNFRHIVHERRVDRCAIRRGQDGKLEYDLDDAPRTRVDSVEAVCVGCRRTVTEKDLVPALFANPRRALGLDRPPRRNKRVA